MALPVGPTPDAEPSPSPAAEGAAGTQAAAASQTTGRKGSQKTSFTTMEDLRREEPELHKSIMQGIAQSIISSLRRHSDRLKRLMRKGREQR